MSNPTKENAMLLDIQYVKPSKKNGTLDYLYIIWRDLTTNEKHLKVIPEPKMDIYFEKREKRDHRYNKNYERIENLDKKTVKYKDIIYAIAEDIGPEGKQYLQNAFNTGNYKSIKTLYLYPYTFGSDYNVVSWYRIQWNLKFNNNLPKDLHKGFLDIEVDGLDVVGMPSAVDCPINAVTLIDDYAKVSYTFILVDKPYRPTNHKVHETEQTRERLYKKMHQDQHYMMEHKEEFINELHEMFDESYGSFDYKLYFYTDEAKMLVHLFQLINILKLDFIGIWNIAFDIPYIINRMTHLGLDPTEVMSHPDFPVKYMYFKESKNHEIKKKNDTLFLTSYTTFYDQMELYAMIRKSGSELKSYSLNTIGQKELKDSKLDYSENGDFKKFAYQNFKKFIVYNIKDVLLQVGIERQTNDFDTLYTAADENATPYHEVPKETLKLRNAQYISFLEQGLIPGNNMNIFTPPKDKKSTKKKHVDEDNEDENVEEFEMEGAVVSDPKNNDYVGVKIYGKPTNNIFSNVIDFDMGSFYPNIIVAMNIDGSTLIFKMIMPINQYDICGGKLKFRGITQVGFERGDDAAKEFIDNFQTGNYTTLGTKWLNLPDISKVYKRMKKELN